MYIICELRDGNLKSKLQMQKDSARRVLAGSQGQTCFLAFSYDFIWNADFTSEWRSLPAAAITQYTAQAV